MLRIINGNVICSGFYKTSLTHGTSQPILLNTDNSESDKILIKFVSITSSNYRARLMTIHLRPTREASVMIISNWAEKG